MARSPGTSVASASVEPEFVSVVEGSAGVAAVARKAADTLLAGGTVIVPTDTVYGLAAHPERAGAVDRLFALKGRDRTKALAVLAADRAQALELLDLDGLGTDTRARVRAMLDAAWPGALTVVGRRAVSWQGIDLGGDPATVGVRVPDSAVMRAIAARVGPVVTTSANRSGDPTPTTAADAARTLEGDVTLVVDAGPSEGLPSTVVDVASTPFRVLRSGAVEPSTLGLPDDGGPDTAVDGPGGER